jgi:acid phosphatase class B
MPKNADFDLVEKIIKRQKNLEDIRRPFEPIWDEVSYFGDRRRPGFENRDDMVKKHGTQIYDGTPSAALNLYVDGILGYYISSALEWFNYRLGGYQLQHLNEDKDVGIWTQEMREAVYWQLNESNFYDAVREVLLDDASIGNANMFIDEDVAESTIDFIVRHPREVFFITNSKGEVVGIHRLFRLNAANAIEDFGEDKVSDNIKNANEQDNMKRMFEFIQAIYPVNDSLPKNYDTQINKRKKFHKHVSYYVEVDQKVLLRRGGYRNLNPITWRMRKYSDEDYGRGLLGDAISEVKRLNSASKTQMEIAQLSAQPPLNVPFEMKDDVDWSPSGQNYYRDAGRIVQPIPSGANYPVTDAYIERLQQAIERHFQVEFFLMLSRADKTMTATEIIEKEGEKVALMSSQLSLISKRLDDTHNRVLNIMYRQGKLPPIPDIVLRETGGFFEIDIDYIGPLAEAQKRLFKARGIRQSLEIAAPYMQMIPGMLDVLRGNGAEIGRELFVTHGMPAKVMNTREEVAAIQKQDAEIAKKQFEMEMAEKESKIAKNLGNQVEPDSIIDKAEKGV